MSLVGSSGHVGEGEAEEGERRGGRKTHSGGGGRVSWGTGVEVIERRERRRLSVMRGVERLSEWMRDINGLVNPSTSASGGVVE